MSRNKPETSVSSSRSGKRSALLRLAALALCAVLLLSASPVVRADGAVDFQALARSGDRNGYTVTVTLAPKYYIKILSGGKNGTPYFVYQNLNDYQQGITDVYGTVQYADNDNNELKLLSDDLIWIGKKDGGWLCDFQGNRLYEEKIMASDVCSLVDKSTNKACGAAMGTAYDYTLNDYYQKTILTADGWSLTAQRISAPQGGLVTYLDTETNKWGAVNLGGGKVLPSEYDQLVFVTEARLFARKGNTYALMKSDGTKALDLPYDEAIPAGNVGILVKKNGLWGAIDLNGSQVVPMEYDTLGYTMNSDFPYRGKRAGINYQLSGRADLSFCGGQEFPDGAMVVGDNLYAVPAADGARKLVDGANRQLITETFYSIKAVGEKLVIWSAEENGISIYDQTGSIQKTKDLEGQDWEIWGDRLVRNDLEENGSAQVRIFDLSGNQQSVLENVKCLHGGKNCLILQDSSEKFAFSDLNGSLLTGFDYNVAVEVSSGTEALQYPLYYAVKEGRAYLFDERTGSDAIQHHYSADKSIGILSPGDYFPIYDQENRVGFAYFAKPGECAFADAKDSAWYAKYVTFCSNAGLLKGTGKGQFEPATPMTRAMLVQVLYNINGEKTKSYGFTDVASGKWYTKAVNWAADRGYVKGISPTTFSPKAEVSREQMVTILYRYAKSFGVSYSGGNGPLDQFADKGAVSKFAQQAMAWAVSNGLITGTSSTTLNPQGSATRAEIATILTRFVHLMAEKR